MASNSAVPSPFPGTRRNPGKRLVFEPRPRKCGVPRDAVSRGQRPVRMTDLAGNCTLACSTRLLLDRRPPPRSRQLQASERYTRGGFSDLGPERRRRGPRWDYNLLRDTAELLALVATFEEPPQRRRRVLQSMLHVDLVLDLSRLHPRLLGSRLPRRRRNPRTCRFAQAQRSQGHHFFCQVACLSRAVNLYVKCQVICQVGSRLWEPKWQMLLCILQLSRLGSIPSSRSNSYAPSIQDELRKSGFPDVRKGVLSTFNLLQNPAIEGTQSQVPVSQVSQYAFLNIDKTAGFLLDQAALSFQTCENDVFKSFSNTFLVGLNAVHKAVTLNYTDRIGLRYLDVVFPKVEEKLPVYLNECVLGLYGNPAVLLYTLSAKPFLKWKLSA